MPSVIALCCRNAVVCVVGRLCKPPNRKKYEEDVAQCNSAIQSKESQLVSMTCDSRVQKPRVDTQKKPGGFSWVNPPKKPGKKPTPNLIQFRIW